MEKFISLASDPDFQPFQWSWPGNHQPMHATMIMLIDLYERPYSPEAPRSRAFIDKIFSLTGPDGGVVGGEDGTSTQRPLKDGGREAWDMIRRLRQQAWQKARLDPQKLWTEQAQFQAGVVSSGSDDSRADPSSVAGPPKTASIPKKPPVIDRDLSDFTKTFYNITRNHVPKSSPLQYQHPPPVPTSSVVTTPQFLHTPSFPQYPRGPETRPLDPALAESTIAFPEALPHTTTPMPFAQAPTQGQAPPPPPTPPPPPAQPQQPTVPNSGTVTTPPAGFSFMDTFTPPAQSMTAVPTPPSMVDPNLNNFDWDQWDAVFGQHLPVADELMELDPVVGFEFPDLGRGVGFNGGW